MNEDINIDGSVKDDWNHCLPLLLYVFFRLFCFIFILNVDESRLTCWDQYALYSYYRYLALIICCYLLFIVHFCVISLLLCLIIAHMTNILRYDQQYNFYTYAYFITGFWTYFSFRTVYQAISACLIFKSIHVQIYFQKNIDNQHLYEHP